MTSTLYQQAVTGNNTRAVRLSVYSRAGVLLTDNLPWTGGGVTESWVSGARSSLSLEIPGGASEFVFAGAEIRPFLGISLGTRAPEIYQMGCFPIEDYDQDLDNPDGSQSLTLGDRWKWVTDANFLEPRQSTPGMLVSDQIIDLIMSTGRFATFVNTSTSTQTMTRLTWEYDRQAAIFDLCKAIGAEVFIDRLGVPVLQNRPTPGVSLYQYTDGEGGTRISWQKATAMSEVKNAVTFFCSWPDPAAQFAPYTASITDPFSPANPRKIGNKPAPPMTDPNVSTRAGAIAAAEKELSRVSARAVQHSIACLPDVARLPADRITLVHSDGTQEYPQVQTVTHPISLDAPQQITTVNTRTDEASGL